MSNKNSNPPQKEQANGIESEKRVNFAMDLLLTGLTNRQVNNKLQAEYNLSFEGARHYVSKAIEDFKQNNENDKKTLRNKYHAMLMSLYQKALLKDDLKLCVSIIDTSAKLNSLYEKEEQSKPDNSIQINFTPVTKNEN